MIAALAAPAHWRCIEFISDLHLQVNMPATFTAWRDYLRATRADALFILGDLFEVWIGDDVLGPEGSANQGSFEAQCVSLLREVSDRMAVYVMQGNRDFLLGPAFAQASGSQLLADPCRLTVGERHWLLSHGDALCLADTDYMAFRREVRGAQWQQDFLTQPLSQRQAIARALRRQSEQKKRVGTVFVDLDSALTLEWLRDASAQTLIHGHTHQGTDHHLTGDFKRVVLSDWDADVLPPRGEVLQLLLDPAGHQPPWLQRLNLFKPD